MRCSMKQLGAELDMPTAFCAVVGSIVPGQLSAYEVEHIPCRHRSLRLVKKQRSICRTRKIGRAVSRTMQNSVALIEVPGLKITEIYGALGKPKAAASCIVCMAIIQFNH